MWQRALLASSPAPVAWIMSAFKTLELADRIGQALANLWRMKRRSRQSDHADTLGIKLYRFLAVAEKGTPKPASPRPEGKTQGQQRLDDLEVCVQVHARPASTRTGITNYG